MEVFVLPCGRREEGEVGFGVAVLAIPSTAGHPEEPKCHPRSPLPLSSSPGAAGREGDTSRTFVPGGDNPTVLILIVVPAGRSAADWGSHFLTAQINIYYNEKERLISGRVIIIKKPDV